MSARVHLLHRDCLPPHEKAQPAPKPAWWILATLVAAGVLWTILG